MGMLKKHYTIIEECRAKHYIGMQMRWDYTERQVHMVMPGYVEKVLTESHHELPRNHQDSPYTCIPKIYGAGSKRMGVSEYFKDLDAAGNKLTQEVKGKVLYFGRVIEGALLNPLLTIAS